MAIVGLAIALLGLPYTTLFNEDSRNNVELEKPIANKDFGRYCSSLNVSCAQLT